MPRPLGEQPLKRLTGLLAGTYRWHPADGGAPQLVDVTYEYDHAVARPASQPDAPERRVREMGGRLEGPV